MARGRKNTESNVKKPNGEGCTLYNEKTGEYSQRITVGWKNGKQIRRTIKGKTLKELAAERASLQDGINKGYALSEKITFAEWIDSWMNVYKRNEVRQTTFESYSIMIKNHIKPSALGGLMLDKITDMDIQEFYNDRLKRGKCKGGGLSPKSVKELHRIISMALKQAVKSKRIGYNPASDTKPPKTEHKEAEFLNIEQVAAFQQIIKTDRYHCAFLLDLGTGLRRGELLGIRWKDLDLKACTVNLRQQVIVTVNNEVLVSELLKTQSSRRIVDLPVDVVQELKKYKRQQAEEKIALGEAYVNNDLVFCQVDGTPYNPNNFRHRFKRLLKSAGLPLTTKLHTLRHTHASMLLHAGEDIKTIQKRLGHRDAATTLNIYTHAKPEAQKEAAAKINDILRATNIMSLKNEETV